jgi:hypothetical protein
MIRLAKQMILSLLISLICYRQIQPITSKLVRNNPDNCKTVISNEQKPKLINLNPISPNIGGLIKVHKT